MTFRLLDTQVRSVESTLLGWVVALACYPPFNHRITDLYIPYNTEMHSWGQSCAAYPALYLITACAIIGLLAVYVAATVCFGLRFSNLTNRGILSKGPYAIVRHPAYASKNIAWWLISLPFLTDAGDCVRLLCWNALYIIRAITEERHLARDLRYRAYMKRVPYRFIPGLV